MVKYQYLYPAGPGLAYGRVLQQLDQHGRAVGERQVRQRDVRPVQPRLLQPQAEGAEQAGRGERWSEAPPATEKRCQTGWQEERDGPEAPLWLWTMAATGWQLEGDGQRLLQPQRKGAEQAGRGRDMVRGAASFKGGNGTI